MVRYKLYGNIGDKGSFGEVLRARQVIDDVEYEQEYALKMLKINEEEARIRFSREVRILKSMNHPRVIKVVDSNLNSKTPFYVMPIYKTSLRACLRDIVGNWVKIKYIFNAMLDGIEYLHSQGICHRDIKPENFLLNSYTDLVVSDLGLGICINSETTRMTRVGVAVGTICYMSPEQMMDSKSIDLRTDIYSLGKVLYECISGIIPTSIDINLLPNGMRYVVSKCVANYVNERFQTVDELRVVFNSSIDILIYGVQKNHINHIIMQLVSEPNNANNIKALFRYLRQMDYRDEQDTVHDIIMKISIGIIIKFEERYNDSYVELIKVFVDNITNNRWAFEYADKIAAKCRDLFYKTKNLNVKTEMIYCLIMLGYYHNRAPVNSCVKEMIYSIKNVDLAYLVKEEIEKIDNNIINKLELTECRLNPIIRKYVHMNRKIVGTNSNSNYY